MIEFPFVKKHSEKLGEILRPIVPVAIVGPKRKINAFMLLDSGADMSLIPYSVGETIGLDIDMSNRGEIQGVGEGSVPYILSRITLQIEDVEISARVGWALIEEVPFIVGRLDVFQNLGIEIREFENRIILKKPSEYHTAS